MHMTLPSFREDGGAPMTDYLTDDTEHESLTDYIYGGRLKL